MRISRGLRLQRWKLAVPEGNTGSLHDTETTCRSRFLKLRQLTNRVHPQKSRHPFVGFDSLFATQCVRWPIPLAYGASIYIVHHLTLTLSCPLTISKQLARLK